MLGTFSFFFFCILTCLFGNEIGVGAEKKGKKKERSKLNHEQRVTLKTIWPQSQQEFEEELGANLQDTLSSVAHNWTKQF